MAERRNPVQRWRTHRGFSLVELVVVVAIVGILMSIALPGYREYVVRANRDAAKAVLLEIVSRQEQYAGTNRAYYQTPAANDLSGLGMTLPTEVSDNYTVDIAQTSWNYSAGGISTTMSGFTASATPIPGKMQANDGTLNINQFGLRTRTLGGVTSDW